MFRPYRAIIRPYYIEPVLIVSPDNSPIGPKHVTLYVLLMVIADVLDENINTLDGWLTVHLSITLV
jgi:hypothetical protein